MFRAIAFCKSLQVTRPSVFDDTVAALEALSDEDLRDTIASFESMVSMGNDIQRRRTFKREVSQQP